MAKETVYKITIELESTDEADLSHFLHWVGEDVEAGRLTPGKTETANQNNVEGTVKYKKETRCEECRGTGEVSTDEDDGEGHTMQGVGTEKCLCQKK